MSHWHAPVCAGGWSESQEIAAGSEPTAQARSDSTVISPPTATAGYHAPAVRALTQAITGFVGLPSIGDVSRGLDVAEAARP